jgi:radical SAM superfamily enzyme YgiQ (UPF0313 family)
VRIIFINPCSPFLMSDKGAPPLGILTLAAEVRAAGYDVALWDLTGDEVLARQFGHSVEDFLSNGYITLPEWIKDQPDDTIFGITCTSAQYASALNIHMSLQWTNPHWRVILGGPHASALPHECFNDQFFTVFSGEADAALVDWLNGGAGFKGIVHCKAPRDLDVLPLPARDLVDLPSYCSNMTVGDGFSSTCLHSRGCVFACRYCVRTLGDAARLLRVRSVPLILSEVHALDDQYSLRRWVTVDDIWGVKRSWLEEFCGVFADEPYHFRVNMRANTLHYDLLPSMKRAGVDVVSFGFESGDERVLSAISKNNVEANTKAVHACHDAGIAVKAYLIFGFAEDDAASVEATLKWVEQVRPDSCQASWLIPLPGTPIYQQAIERGWTPLYHELYHLGRDKRGSMNRLPWHTDETAELYEGLCEWLEGFYAEAQPSIECPNALSSQDTS